MLTGIVDAIVACVIPLIPILIGSGVLQAIVLIIQQFDGSRQIHRPW
ncbi:MAG: hypothetical protein ACLVJ6_10145 [Merdibacter sp.]